MHPKQQLLDGTIMPAFGLGTWKSKPGEVYDAVRAALELGYRHVDCAAIYGNEAEVGRAFEDAFRAGDAEREDVWITSKLWNDSHQPERVGPALEKTLSDLRLEYLDLYLMHWPVALTPGTGVPQSADEMISLEDLPLETTWTAMLEEKAKGRTRQVGVSNFSVKKVRRLAEAAETPAVNQVEAHPYLGQIALVEGCRAQGVAVTAYSPLGSPDSARMMGREDDVPLLMNPVILEIAHRTGGTAGQVLISWALRRGTSVIPKSVSRARIEENLKAIDLDLDRDAMKVIDGLDRHHRLVDGTFWFKHPSYTEESLWDEQA